MCELVFKACCVPIDITHSSSLCCVEQVDTFLHTYTIKTMDNVWSGERNVALNTTEWQLLQPRNTSFTDQQLFLDTYECAPFCMQCSSGLEPVTRRHCWCRALTDRKGIHSVCACASHCADVSCRGAMHKCHERGHAWPLFEKSDFTIVDNLFCQLNSIAEVNELWYEAHQKTPFHAVMFARPDVLFNCPFDASYLDTLHVRLSLLLLVCAGLASALLLVNPQ